MHADKLSISKLRRVAAEAYLTILSGLDRLTLGGQSGQRRFKRVCIVTAAARQNGISQGARLQLEALRRAGIDAELLDATPALRNPLFRIPHAPATAYVFHSGGPQLASMLASVLPHARGAWRIAYWAWELPTPPKAWPQPKGLVSEIWTPSEFARSSLSQIFRLPIKVVPHVIVPSERPYARKCGTPFTVLVMADSRSSLARKNPSGAVRAFGRAFGNTDSAKLIIKLNGGDVNREELLGETRNWSNIEIIDSYLTDGDLKNLFNRSDVFLSLHRAEGFGIPLLEAMATGLPVVATGWSGNLEFMTETNSLLIPFKLVPVNDRSVYSRYKDAVWAEADEAWAAQALVRLHENLNYRSRMADAAYSAAGRLFKDWPTQLSRLNGEP